MQELLALFSSSRRSLKFSPGLASCCSSSILRIVVLSSLPKLFLRRVMDGWARPLRMERSVQKLWSRWRCWKQWERQSAVICVSRMRQLTAPIWTKSVILFALSWTSWRWGHKYMAIPKWQVWQTFWDRMVVATHSVRLFIRSTSLRMFCARLLYFGFCHA